MYRLLIVCLAAVLSGASLAQAPTLPGPASAVPVPGAAPAWQSLCDQVATAIVMTDVTKAGELLLKSFDEAARFAQPSKISLDTLYVQGGKPSVLLIDTAAEPADYFIGVAWPEPAARASLLSVRSLPATVSPPAPKRLEITVHAPEAPDYLSYGKLDVHVVMCLREPPKPNADKPTVIVARAEALISTRPIPFIAAIVLTALLYLACGATKAKCSNGRRIYFNPLKITAGVTGQASLSNLQFFMFTLLVFGLLVYALLRTGVLVDLSENVLLLLGVIGAGTTAVLLTVPARDRLSAINVRWMRERKWLGVKPRANELITDGEDIAIERVQSLAFALIVFFFMLFQGGMKLASFAIPQGILGILAASQAIFVAGRAVRAGTAGQAPSGAAQGEDRRLDDFVSDARIKWTVAAAEKDPAKKQGLQSAYQAAAKLAAEKLLERLHLDIDPVHLS